MTTLPAAPRGERRGDVVTSVVLVALVVLQHPGTRFFDTKLDLAVNPGGFLARALSVWNPQAGFGQLQNQAYGYLFPMGPFFAGGHALGLPSWVVERAWQSLLLVGAYIGAVRLARRLGVGTPSTRWLAALSYALAPRVVTTLGPISAETLAVVLLPWVLLPLLGWQERTSARVAAARSALAVLLIGGVNAAVVLAVLPLPGLWLLRGCGSRAGRRLTAWWLGAVSLVCLWWLVPLLVLGRYSSPFLDFIETAANTTSPLTPFQVLRGTTDWIPYLSRSGQPWWPAGWDLVTGPWLILSTSVVAGLGLVGLAGRRMPGRGPLLASAAVGLAVLAAGSTVSPVAGLWHDLLDGVITPFRNVHKFDPLVRLPLSLGLAHSLAALPALRRRAVATGGRRWSRLAAPATSAVAVVAVLAVVAPTWPFLARHLDPGPGWPDVPTAWRQAAAFVAYSDPTARSLVVPAASFGEFVWGRTIDEPMQPLARAPWAVRDQVPLGAAGSTRLADAVEQVLAAGRPSASLAPALGRSGVRFLVVRNDLDWRRTASARPAVVHAVVDRSPGLTRVAAFGPQVGPLPAARAGPAEDGSPVTGYGLDAAYPQVEVYAVRGAAAGTAGTAAGTSAVPVARAVPLASVAVLSGGPESLLPALEAGLVAPSQPTVLAGQRPTWLPASAPVVRSDGLRRRDRNVGRVQGNLSVTLTATEPRRITRAAPDLVPFEPRGHETTAVYPGAPVVTASTSQGFADSFGPTRPDAGPFAALDGDPGTAWRSSTFGSPVGQWLEVRLATPVEPEGLQVTFLRDFLLGPQVTEARLMTDTGSRTTAVPESGTVTLDAAPGPTRLLRVEVTGVRPGTGDAGISELTLPGGALERSLTLPDDAAGPLAGVVATDDTLPRPVCLPVGAATRCDPALARGTEDSTALDRRLVLRAPAELDVSAAVVARDFGTVARFLDPVGAGIRATASSVLLGAVQARAGAAVDGDAGTAWVAGQDDPAPALTLSWGTPRTIDRLTVVPAGSGASSPTALRLESPAGTRDVDLTLGSTARFAPLTTDRMTLRVTGTSATQSIDPLTGFRTTMPPGIAELTVPALADLVYTPRPEDRIGAACGLAPAVEVDGAPVATRYDATLGDLLAGGPITLRACDGPVRLEAGAHHVRLRSTLDFVPASLVLRPPSAPGAAVPAGRSTEVLRWAAEHRSVRVGPGGAALLVVPEGTNPGWQASLAGRRLPATVVDGWQQAYLLPPGAGGTVTLAYPPGTTQRAGLLVGALAALVVVAAAVVPGRRRPDAEDESGRREGRATRWLLVLPYLALAVPVLVAGWIGVVASAAGLVVGRRRLSTALVTAGGPAVVGAVAAVDRVRHDSITASSAALVTLLVLAAFSTAVVAGSARPGRSAGAPHQEPQDPPVADPASGPTARTTT